MRPNTAHTPSTHGTAQVADLLQLSHPTTDIFSHDIRCLGTADVLRYTATRRIAFYLVYIYAWAPTTGLSRFCAVWRKTRGSCKFRVALYWAPRRALKAYRLGGDSECSCLRLRSIAPATTQAKLSHSIHADAARQQLPDRTYQGFFISHVSLHMDSLCSQSANCNRVAQLACGPTSSSRSRQSTSSPGGLKSTAVGSHAVNLEPASGTRFFTARSLLLARCRCSKARTTAIFVKGRSGMVNMAAQSGGSSFTRRGFLAQWINCLRRD